MKRILIICTLLFSVQALSEGFQYTQLMISIMSGQMFNAVASKPYKNIEQCEASLVAKQKDWAGDYVYRKSHQASGYRMELYRENVYHATYIFCVGMITKGFSNV